MRSGRAESLPAIAGRATAVNRVLPEAERAAALLLRVHE